MSPCEAFQLSYRGWARCDECGQPYWVHSHEYALEGRPMAGARIKHTLIPWTLAHKRWSQYATDVDPRPDLRPRYDIMAERRVSISKFVATHIITGRLRAEGESRPGSKYMAAVQRNIAAALEGKEYANHG